MKKLIGFAVCFCIFSIPVFSQAVNRDSYTAIDPFDYWLNEEQAARRAVRRFKAVVEFVSQNGQIFNFISADRNTRLDVRAPVSIAPPSPGRTAVIYFTATKGNINDTRILDDIDYTVTTESGIGLVKSSVNTSSGVNRSLYTEISAVDYKDDALFTQEDDDDRQFRAIVRFESQDGILYRFHFDNTDDETIPPIYIRVRWRIPVLSAGQLVTVYFTASKEIKDHLFLDHIEY
ncbi:MAG: hypothetical protein FWG89_06285 [Treponema sp.]|nr:hypothetical protein [Treponema sp.]